MNESTKGNNSSAACSTSSASIIFDRTITSIDRSIASREKTIRTFGLGDTNEITNLHVAGYLEA